MTFATGALAIHGAASALAKFANQLTSIVDGTIVQVAAADCAALGGAVVPNGSKNVYVFAHDVSGNLFTYNGTPATTLAGIVWPTVPDGQVVFGFAVVANGTGSNFTPGTTALDTASLTVTYVNTPFPFVPGMQSV